MTLAYDRATLLFSRKTIRENMAELARLGRRHRCRILMAVKSFPYREVIGIAGTELDGFDISNLAERKLLPKSAGAGWIWWTNPAQFDAKALRQVLASSKKVVVTVDGENQYRTLTSLGIRCPLVLRLSTDETLKSGKLSRFGSMPALMKSADVQGFHFHHGRQFNRASDYVKLAKAALTISKKEKIPLRFLNLGGGLHRLSFQEIDFVLRSVRKIVGRDTEVFFEPGRLLSRGAGFATGRVENMKKGPKGWVAVVNLSRTCHLNWSEVQLTKLSETRGTEKVRIYGPTCFEDDFIGEFLISRSELPAVGDPILFAGVCGYSAAWNRSFNGIPEAKVVFT